MSDSTLPLSGIRVIDCGTYIAGPAAAVVMSDFGADAIQIERPPYGDPYRHLSRLRGSDPTGGTRSMTRSRSPPRARPAVAIIPLQWVCSRVSCWRFTGGR